MADLQRHSDEGWIKEGMILYYETPDLQTAKVTSGHRVGQTLELPKKTDVEFRTEILIKVRVKSRSFYCKALVLGIKENTFTVQLPHTGWKSLPRKRFFRIKLSRWGRFNENTANIKDISVAGAAIEVTDPNGLTEGMQYKFQTGRFTTSARINEITGNRVRVQFPIRDNLSMDLNCIVRDCYRQEKEQGIGEIRNRKTEPFSRIASA